MIDQKTSTETIQAIVSRDLAAELRARAAIERRSLSSVVRNAIEDALRPSRLLPRSPDEDA